MKRFSNRARLALALTVPAAVAAGAVVACSSSDSSTGSTTGATSCATNDLTVEFAPMYSAYESSHTYQIPAVVDGVAADAVKWGISDTSIADIANDPNTGGIMLTIKKAGTATVVASAGSLCGSSQLTVTSATSDQWQTGSDRYNNGVPLALGRGPGDGDGGGGPPADEDAGKTPACTNCHGPTATNGGFKTIAHTPEQTGGFSDDDLKNIFRNGMVPDGGYFDPSIVSYSEWQRFHTWSMTDDEAAGIVVYLRALTPTPQTGSANFGGRFPDGGHFHPPAIDAGQ